MKLSAVRGRGLAASRVTVVHNGVDILAFQPLPHARRLVYEMFGIPEDRRIVVYMGHLHERKGVHVLLRCVDGIMRSGAGEKLHFLFLGNLPGQENNFAEYYDAALCGSHITFGGYQDRIPEILAGCALGCLPTTEWDSFPLSPLEMQACGVPVVVTDCQGLPETIQAGKTGLVVQRGDPKKLADALLGLLAHPVELREFGAAARVRIEGQFDRSLQVARIGDILAG